MTQQPYRESDGGPFDRLVQEHIGWVYGVARRQLSDANLADDATQAVFITLWNKRKRLAKNARPVGGWLALATHYACENIKKTERRRKIRERKVAAMRQEEMQGFASAAAEESKLEQLLAMDAALQRLPTGDRDVLVARFFQNQTARQVAEQFNISEAAAGKRITRAVTKLRGIMDQKNIAMDSTALAALLSSGAATAPNGLLEKVLQGVCGKAPVSLTAAHAAHSITFHTAHIPAIAGAAAVALAIGVAAVAPIAIKARQAPVKPVTAAIAPAIQVATANFTAAQSGVLTCVAYEMLVQRDFAWAIRTGGKLLPGKPGGVKAYDISARVVRALARAMIGRREVLLGTDLHWISTAARIRPWPIVPLYLRQTFYLAGSGDGFIANTSLKLNSPSVRTYSKFARVPVSFLAGSQISASFVRKPNNAPVPYDYQNTFNIHAGHAAVLLKHVYDFQGKQCYSAVVFDVERYPYHEFNTVGAISGVRRYIRVGPAGLKHIAEVATAWNRYAMAHPPKPVAEAARWTKSLPGGAVVTLQRIFTGRWPLCLWTPVGAPAGIFLSEIPLGNAPGNLGTGHVSGLLKLELPTGETGPTPGARTLPKNVFVYRWVGIRRQTNTCSVGLDSGPWKIIGTAKPTPSPDPKWYFSYKGYQFDVYALTRQPADPSNHMPSEIYMNLWTSSISTPNLVDRAIAVGAVNRQGQLVPPHPGRMPYYNGFVRFQTSRAHAMDEYSFGEAIPISPNNVKRYVWITRPRHWVTFRGFALQPSPLPSTVYALARRQRRAITTRATRKAKPIASVAANQTTPAGLMVLLGRAMRSGNPLAPRRLIYAPNSAERHLLAMDSTLDAAREAARNSYGLWGVAKKRFGVAQMQAAGLGEFVNNSAVIVHLPKHWKIKGAYATPLLPLPRGVSWPGKGQPMHSLIKKNGLWYLDFSLTKAQIAQFNEGMRRSLEFPNRNAKAYHVVLKQLQAGKIKDAYALRDALAAALKKYSEPTK